MARLVPVPVPLLALAAGALALSGITGQQALAAAAPGAPTSPRAPTVTGPAGPAVESGYTNDDVELTAVTAPSTDDAWAVGFSNARSIVLHWDGSSWSNIPTPHPRSARRGFSDKLTAVSADASNDAWAVGNSEYYNDVGARQVQPLVQHWDGVQWTAVDVAASGFATTSGISAITPSDVWLIGADVHGVAGVTHWDGASWTATSIPPGSTPSLVSADASSDVWAASTNPNTAGEPSPILHWNGTGWQESPTSVPGVIHAMSTLSPSDVWAVGGHGTAPLVEHWNGASWAKIPSPKVGDSTVLTSVKVVSAGDAWATGSSYTSGSGGIQVIEHWDGSTWSVVSDGNSVGNTEGLSGVTATGPDDVWAVGSHFVQSQYAQSERTFIERWDGTTWARVSSPNPGQDDDLNGVVAQSPSDIWAVGYNGVNGATLVEHSDGTGWTRVPSPSPGGPDRADQLFGVSAESSTDVWAVGIAGERPLIEHWDGSTWKVSPSPRVEGSGELDGVSAVSPSNAWAVGSGLVEHWDGTAWTKVHFPRANKLYSTFTGVSALSASNIWVVGWYEMPYPYWQRTLVEHWDGTSWTIVPSPNPGGPNDSSFLSSVDAVATNDVWAVGDTVGEPLVEHWDGTSWTAVANPGQYALLRAVSASSPSDVWAVGTSPPYGDTHTFAEHWDGSAWTTVATANPGGTENYQQDTMDGVLAFSPTNALTVGSYLNVHSVVPLEEHWDGTTWSQWKGPF